MTDDVIEQVLAGEKRPEFPVPPWVPAIIAAAARDLFGREAGHDALLVRLMTDPRMRTVWAHLTRRRRHDGRFLQPAQLNLYKIVDPTKRQDHAMLWLFCWVLEIAANKPRALLRREIDENRREREALARKLSAEAHTLTYLEAVGEGRAGRARILSDAAAILFLLNREDGSPGDIVVERDRHKLETRAAASAIAGTCCWLFGAPLYTLSATLTAVALDCEVTAREVREWWRERPIQPSADKGSFFAALSAVCKPRV